MRLRWILFIFFIWLALPSCAIREPIAPVASRPEATSEALLFNNEIATLPEDSTQYFAKTPFGPATINAGSFYTSGLGHKCRLVRVTTETKTHNFALCRKEDGNWHLIPSIFENIVR